MVVPVLSRLMSRSISTGSNASRLRRRSCDGIGGVEVEKRRGWMRNSHRMSRRLTTPHVSFYLKISVFQIYDYFQAPHRG